MLATHNRLVHKQLIGSAVLPTTFTTKEFDMNAQEMNNLSIALFADKTMTEREVCKEIGRLEMAASIAVREKRAHVMNVEATPNGVWVKLLAKNGVDANWVRIQDVIS